MTPPVDIAGLRALVERATPGPWVDDTSGADAFVFGPSGDELARIAWHGSHHTDEPEAHDARFIAAARTAVPALCDRVEELERLLERQDEPAHLLHARLERDRALADLAAAREENARLRAEVADLTRRHERAIAIIGRDMTEKNREALLVLAESEKSDEEGGVG